MAALPPLRPATPVTETPAALRCSDPDDHMFLDLALAHQAVLLSKDRSVLKLASGLAAVGVPVRRAADFIG